MKFNGLMLTDLDGTLLSNNSSVSDQNYQQFELLARKSIVRAAATGRSVYSARKVLPPDFPIDYLIFSSGAGIMKWETGEMLKTSALDSDSIHAVADFFVAANLDFSIHAPIPETHCFHWYASATPNPDFLKRLQIFKEFARTGDYRLITSATQLLAVTDSCDQLLADLKQNFKRLNIIRATSPLDKKAIWIEVFPEKVSKGHAAEWLSELLAIDPAFCMSVGNDYNDLAMLEWTRHSYIMQNAALELQKQFFCVPDNNSNGFSFAINHWLKELGL